MFNISLLSVTFLCLAIFILKRLYHVLFQSHGKFEKNIKYTRIEFCKTHGNESIEERSNKVVETHFHSNAIDIISAPLVVDENFSLNSPVGYKTRAGRKTGQP